MKRPIESDYTSFVGYTRALEEYCDTWAQPPQRKPLTDEEIKAIWLNGKDHGDDWLDVQGIARAIEAAHGIKE